MEIKKIVSATEFSLSYRIILCDLWGVIHNGVEVFSDAKSYLEVMKENNIDVYLISNAPRPEAVVRNGLISCMVPYATPGKELREEIKKQVGYFVEEEEFFPKLILLENHGIITTGSTHTECIASTLMCEKSAEIFIGAKLLGQIKYLTEEEIAAVDKCPNEAYRRKLFQ